MLMQEPTAEMVKRWKSTWYEYKDILLPNRKSGSEVVECLVAKYPLTELTDDRAAQVVIDNVLFNEHSSEKLPEGMRPSAVTFLVENRDEGSKLYQEQDEIWGGCDIFVGVELASGNYQVEGSSLLWDELCAFQGLDESDIQNYFCAAQYISALERFGLLETTLRASIP